MRRLLLVLWIASAACGDNTRAESLTIHTTEALAPAIGEMARFIPFNIRVSTSADPVGALSASDRELAVVDGLACEGDCYQIDSSGAGYVVRGGNLIGAQYGLGQALEGLGIGFFHPHRSHVPAKLNAEIPASRLETLVEPEVTRRGLHLHILHPIEPYFAFWEPGEENLEDAKRMINWGIAIGANYFQWTALDNINRAGELAPWTAHNQAILDYARSRGAAVGVGIQLYGSSNLQNAFDLVDDPDAAIQPQIEERLPTILGNFEWDHVSLSFGEFFGADPDKFVTDTNTVIAVLDRLSPQTTISATVHVGEDQRIDYMGRDQIYYFLVRYADPKLIPWLHTVMYYNLFEDAGGAYHHDSFTEHKDYLYERMNADLPVGYHPETAYWVAFDNSVPVYNPLYVRSRWLDLDRIATDTGKNLPEHIVFSTGWEWGYWQNDAATFRQSVRRASSPREVFDQLFAPLGDAGLPLAKAAFDTAEIQHEFLLEKRLAGYIAGADISIDLGYISGIVSQPRPVLLSELIEFDESGRQAFATDVIEPLRAMAVATEAIRQELAAAPPSIWGDEMLDGLDATVARAEYVAATLQAGIDFANGASTSASLAAMDAAFERGRAAVDRRHAQLWDPNGKRLTERVFNNTLYQFGYLKQAQELCYWARERTDLLNRLNGEENLIETCFN